MMKFKQRVIIISLFILIVFLYLWVKIKPRSNRENPVVQVSNEENLLRALLLDGAYDFNNLDHKHTGTSIHKRTTEPEAKSDINTEKISATGVTIAATSNLKTKALKNVVLHKTAWKLWQEMVKVNEVTQHGEEGTLKVNRIVKALQTAPIIQTSVGYKGTQLKTSMFLKGNQRTVFKPKRYERDYIIEGVPYSGFDRHNGEIAAFHLDRILGFYRAPIVTGRIVNLKTEVMPNIQAELARTFFKEGNNTCFYGICYYCKKREAACANGDVMEGSVTIWLPEGWSLRNWRHPWQRTYREDRKARWEIDQSYCTRTVMRTPPYNRGPRLMFIIDTAIFDFFIGNADRHHYETLVKGGDDAMVLHLDNGKSFGNPDWDELSILAPLYQCCRILRSTWERIKSLSNQNNKKLSEVLKESLSSEPLSPVLSQKHLDAIDRRLKMIVKYVEACIKIHGESVVVVADHN
ncbi:glycosaminoglycan xylosylkinase-like [Dendronephthya gigantea]|uniref:glycosaminoglycan xylosylkinase-like n=1 Tax=Dendronephthya gigantea TaxID=151771 RepID=UPI00106CDCAC|nr:glycosaminoglycan xylosylkinase-like [Dendronephthya gigantea]